jgi:hypothetical protein
MMERSLESCAYLVGCKSEHCVEKTLTRGRRSQVICASLPFGHYALGDTELGGELAETVAVGLSERPCGGAGPFEMAAGLSQ